MAAWGVEASTELNRKYYSFEQLKNGSDSHEGVKFKVVGGPDAVVEPAAVVVEKVYASIASLAVKTVVAHTSLASSALELVIFAVEDLPVLLPTPVLDLDRVGGIDAGCFHPEYKDQYHEDAPQAAVGDEVG